MDIAPSSLSHSTVASSSGDRSLAAVRRSALVPRLRGVNGNSLGSRRYREVAMALADDHGGPDALDELTRVLIRQAAGLTVEAENLQRCIARGEAVNHEDLVRITRVLAMLMHRLGLKRAAASRRRHCSRGWRRAHRDDPAEHPPPEEAAAAAPACAIWRSVRLAAGRTG